MANPMDAGGSVADRMEKLAGALSDFDYGVDPDDFVIYEVNRLIEEERASFEDAEFRALIDEGIAGHVTENLRVRAALAGRLREAAGGFDPETRKIAGRVIHATEDPENNPGSAAVVVRTYTAYLFRQLESMDAPLEQENQARSQISEWLSGGGDAAELRARLCGIGRPAVGPLADLLFEGLEDRAHAQFAIDTLEAIPCPISARVLAHAVGEPLLEEDLEERATRALRKLWPLPRRYMLYSLGQHTHEDLPWRWFQLFVDVLETSAVDRAIDELVIHGANPIFQEDLASIMGTLLRTRDPQAEEKILAAINQPNLPVAAGEMLETFLREYQAPPPLAIENDPWKRDERLASINRKYLAAARLFDSGQTADAITELDRILAAEPDYPFALMLKECHSRSL